MSLHPWNEPLWRRLTADPAQLPHALLLHGPAGTGKKALALTLANWLLCEFPAESGPCGRCDACGWFAQGNHPDFRLVEPLVEEEEEGREKVKAKKGARPISVEQVREVLDFAVLSAHRGGWRVVLLHPAESLNVAAANALLKTLEEPPAGVMLILVAHRPRRLLPTVLSRCHKLAVPLPGFPVALDWLDAQGLADAESLLREAGGAPLAALGLAEAERLRRRDALLAALAQPARQDWPALAQSQQTHLADGWGWLSRWVHDLLACQGGAVPRYFPCHGRALASLSQDGDAGRLWRLRQRLLDDGRWLHHPLNSQLLLESWLLDYQHALERP